MNKTINCCTNNSIKDARPFRRAGLYIKVGQGQGDGDIGTRVWGLGTWGRETRDLRTTSMGRGDV